MSGRSTTPCLPPAACVVALPVIGQIKASAACACSARADTVRIFPHCQVESDEKVRLFGLPYNTKTHKGGGPCDCKQQAPWLQVAVWSVTSHSFTSKQNDSGE
jgi:hypothetical protein